MPNPDSPAWQEALRRRRARMEERRDRVVELTLQGASVAEIAAAVGVSISTIQKDRLERGTRSIGGDVGEERRGQVAELSRQGMSVAQIAEKLKVTGRTVNRDRVRLGIAKPSPRPLTEQELATVEEMLADGASLSEAARTVGRSVHTLFRRFKGRGWTAQQVGEYLQMLRVMKKLESRA